MRLKDSFHKTYRLVIGSIAFYPTIIATVFFIIGLLMMAFEYHDLAIEVKKYLSFLLVNSKEDARLILGTLVGSIISLMVFSFSMVMLVLNRATATLSPRVIPGLITDKSNQVVLGCYLGSIIYCLILIINIQSATMTDGIPALGILLAMIFGIACLGCFVYFIHTISLSIQVDNIQYRILKQTLNQMDENAIKPSDPDLRKPDTSEWHILKTPEAGYLKQVKAKALIKLCSDCDFQMELLHPIGHFHIEHLPYLKVSRALDQALEKQVHSLFVFYPEEHLEDHYIFGTSQISEIAVKALSPGINDPGTAIKSIDMLSLLLIKKMNIVDKQALYNEACDPCLFLAPVSFEDLLYETLTPIRDYGKQDALVMYNLLEGLKNMLYDNKDESDHEVIITFANSVLDTCMQSIHSDLDIKRIDQMANAIKGLISANERVLTLEERGTAQNTPDQG